MSQSRPYPPRPASAGAWPDPRFHGQARQMGGASGATIVFREPALHANPLHFPKSCDCLTVVLEGLGELLDLRAGIQVCALSAELKPLLVDTAVDQLAVPGPVPAFLPFRPAAVAADLVQVNVLTSPVVQLLFGAQVDRALPAIQPAHTQVPASRF